MTSQTSNQGLSLYEAARRMGVPFAREVPPQDRYVQANGLRFHYLEWDTLVSGQPSGEAQSGVKPTMLMLHGFAQTCHSWDFVALALCNRFRVIALDQRGHGDTDWAPDGDYSPEAYQRDLHAIADALDLRDLVVVGLSMGGRNAFTFAAMRPDRMRALVIVDAGPENRRAGTENIRRFVQETDELDSLEDFVKRVQQFNPRRPAEQIRGSIAHNLKQLPNGKWTWKYDKALRSPDRRAPSDPEVTRRLWGYLEGLQCPTLVVRGAQSDVIALETAEEMVRRIPRGRLVTVENAGHLVPGDNPEGFIRAVEEFLGSRRTSGT